MSIATEITRIQNAKTALKTAINSKGGTLTTQTISSYAAAVDAIKTEDTFYKCTQITYQQITPYTKITACNDTDAIGTYVKRSQTLYEKSGQTYLDSWQILGSGSWWLLCHNYEQFCYLNTTGSDIVAGTYTYQGNTVTITDVTTQQPVSWSGKKATITGTGMSFAQTTTTGLAVGDALQLYGVFTAGCTKRIYEDKLFYKCSANTDSNTKWDGYLLTITASGISYASTAVSGLANDTGSALQINGIYTNGGTQRIYQSTLVAGNIRKDVQLLGITGTLDASGVDVSDTTTTAAQALSGTQFHIANGNLVQGTIASKASQVYTPTTNNQIISAGQYLSGDQTIQGDSYLLPANIASGVTIFGVTGTHQGGGANVTAGYFTYANGTLSFTPTGGQPQTVTDVYTADTGVAQPEYPQVTSTGEVSRAGYFTNVDGQLTFTPVGGTAQQVDDLYITDTGVAQPEYPQVTSTGEVSRAGYFTNVDGQLTFTPVGGTAQQVDDLYITNTGVAQPTYPQSTVTQHYKCATVDTQQSTWTGYLASVDSSTGIWTFASSQTPGLTFDASHIVPQQDSVYDKNATYLVTGYPVATQNA